MPLVDAYLPANWGLKTDRYSHLLKDWVRTPNFRTLPRRDLPTNRYHHEYSLENQDYFDGAYRLAANGTKTYEPGYGPGYVFTGNDINTEWRNYFATQTDIVSRNTALASDLKLKLLTKIADTKTNAGVMAAEAHKTSRMIEDTAERVYSAYHAFRRGNFKAVANILNLKRKTVHKNWLEYKYGWMPMLMDVKGTAELFAQQWVLGGRPPRFSVGVRGNYESSYPNSTTYAAWGGNGVTFVRRQQLLYKHERHFKVWIEVNSQSLTAAQQAGLTNPALVAWELVPYSFVFDWFISVGDWLTALTALNGLTIVRTLDESISEFRYDRVDPPTRVFDVGTGTTFFNSQYHFKNYTRDYNRNTFSFDTVPDLPRLKNPFPSFQKAVSSVALIKARMR